MLKHEYKHVLTVSWVASTLLTMAWDEINPGSLKNQVAEFLDNWEHVNLVGKD